MIQASTILEVADNSGAKKINCINILGGYRKKSSICWRRNHWIYP